MATKKITELNELETANDNDLLVIVDVTNNETKKIKAVNIGTGGSVDIPQQDTAPEDSSEDDLWIDTDDNTNLVGVVNSTTVSDKDTYSCNYLNQHLYDMYSTNEVLTNKIWIDGRPVYRKVYEFTTSSNNSDFSIGALPSNISSVVCTTAIIGTPTQGIVAPNTWDNTYGVGIAWFNGNITGRLNFSSYANKDGILILEYTKTTDSGDR